MNREMSGAATRTAVATPPAIVAEKHHWAHRPRVRQRHRPRIAASSWRTSCASPTSIATGPAFDADFEEFWEAHRDFLWLGLGPTRTRGRARILELRGSRMSATADGTSRNASHPRT